MARLAKMAMGYCAQSETRVFSLDDAPGAPRARQVGIRGGRDGSDGHGSDGQARRARGCPQENKAEVTLHAHGL